MKVILTCGSSPLMVNGTLFIESSGSIKALDPTTGNILWTGAIGSIHWQSPAVIDGHVFTLDNNNLTAFAVPGGLPTVAPVSTGNPGNNPTILTPVPSKFVCLGSCPTVTPISPTQTQLPVVTLIPTQAPIISNPCPTSSSSVNTSSSKQHVPNSGSLSSLLQILIGFLIQLIQLLLGGGSTITPTPCVTTTP